jgi:hypothetical protein
MKHEKVKTDNPKANIISFLLMWASQARTCYILISIKGDEGPTWNVAGMVPSDSPNIDWYMDAVARAVSLLIT